MLRQFGPLIEYGLDDDPHRPEGNGSEENPPGDHLLSLRSTDPYEGYVDLAEMPHQKDIALPDRLSQLGFWIAKVAHEPVVLWWAAKHKRPHPILIDRIERRIRQNSADFPPLARSIWRLLFEKFGNVPDDNSPGSLFKVKQLIAAEGWTNGVLREFERSASPFLKSESRPVSRLGRPPQSDWPELKLSDIAGFQIGFPRVIDIGSDVPDEVLPAVYRIGRRQLEQAVEMLGDVDLSAQEGIKFLLRNNTGAMRGDNPNIYLQWFHELLSRMVETRPELVRADMALWPDEDPFFFHGLRLYAWSFDMLFTGDEVADGLLSLSDKTFWNTSHRRELLHLLRSRWQELPAEKRRLLEERIVGGRERYERESDEDYSQWKSIQSAGILGWLANQGCDLTDDSNAVLPSLRNTHADWSPEWDEAADDHSIGEGGWVETNSDASAILYLPLDQVIPQVKERTKSSFSDLTDFKPFEGLIEQRPYWAVAALVYEAKKGDYPMEFWSTALQKWPEDASPRLTRLFGAKVAQLPSEAVVDLRSDLFWWLKSHISKLAVGDQACVLSIIDALLDKLFENGEDATESSIGDVRVAGDNHGWSRKTFFHAINSPVGTAAGMLLDLLKSRNLEEESGIPSEVKFRLKRLVRSPGEGGYHAICVIAQRLEWLHYLDPDWARTTIVPWFNPGHPYSEPAWNGFLHWSRPPRPKLFSLLRSHFLNVFKHARTWKWNDEGFRILHQFLIIGCLWREHDEVYLSFAEVRRALQLTDETGRSHAITYLTDLIERKKNQVNWHHFGKRFLDEAWPKEIRFQTEDTAITLSQIAGVSGDHFPEAVQTILPRLVWVFGDRGFLYRVVSRCGTEEFELATRFPEATLALVNKLVPNNPPERLSDLDLILDKIAEAKPTLRQDRRWRRLKKIARLE